MDTTVFGAGLDSFGPHVTLPTIVPEVGAGSAKTLPVVSRLARRIPTAASRGVFREAYEMRMGFS
jgi:hypothetical protein